MNRVLSASGEATVSPLEAPLWPLALLLVLSPLPAFAVASHEDFASLAAQCAPAVHVSTLSAIVRHESSLNPYAIGVNAKGFRLPRQPRTKQEAVAAASWLQQHGYNFDGGYGQVNVKNLAWLGMTLDDLFDPCKNLQGAAKVLTDCFQRASPRYGSGQDALHRALSCYNTGNFRDGLSNGYVLKVAANATLEVPALMPLQGSPQPLKLEAAQHPKPAPAAQPLPDGMGDAFSSAQDDAFTGARKASAEAVREKNK